ncbi:MAG: hypothetical protein ABIQ33_13235 [Caldimonas sp.]
MSFDRASLSGLVASLLLTAAFPVHSADSEVRRPRVLDPARAKAQDADRQRLIAKLNGEAPKVMESPAPTNPLDAPIFHRHDRR